MLGKLGQNQGKPTIIHYDSSSTIELSKNPVMHGRSKHIDVRFHFLRDLTKVDFLIRVLQFLKIMLKLSR